MAIEMRRIAPGSAVAFYTTETGLNAGDIVPPDLGLVDQNIVKMLIRRVQSLEARVEEIELSRWEDPWGS